MERKDRSVFFLGLGLFVNTIVGVGIFGLPYVASRAGFGAVAGYFVILSVVVYVIHRLYAAIVVYTEGQHRFPGYVGYWLGPAWKRVAYATNVTGITAALIAYLVVGGIFVSSLIQQFTSFPEILGVVSFAVAGSTIVFFGRRTVAKTELTFLALLLVLIGAISIISIPHISLERIGGFSLSNLFLPYGIVFFSFWGSSIIPELVEITGKDSTKTLRRILLWGMVIAFIAYALFTFVVLGVTGADTSTEAMRGLENALGDGVILAGYLLGIVTTFTSFLSLGLTLQRVYAFDAHLPRVRSWMLACLFPLALYLAGIDDYIRIVTFVGALLLGFEGIMLFMVYRKVQEKVKTAAPLRLGWIWAVSAFFLLGVVAELFYFIRDLTQ